MKTIETAPAMAGAGMEVQRPTLAGWLRLAVKACIAASAIATGIAAHGQAATTTAGDAQYPDRAIRMVVPYGPAGSPDVLARAVAQHITSVTGTAIIVDNKPGANGAIALQTVTSTAPDGYTVFIADTGHMAINPALYKKLPYDPLNDFAPVSLAVSSPFFLVVNANVQAQTLPQLIAYARQNPGKLSYGSSGNGSPHHLATELFKSIAGIDIAHIPYKGVAESVPALMGGQIDMMLVALPSVSAALDSVKLRVLAVSSGERSSLRPEVPTMNELGVEGFDMGSRIGFLVPAKTPAARIAWLNRQIVESLSDPEMVRRLRGLGLETIASSSADYAAALRSDLPKFQKLVAITGIRID